MIKKTEEIKFDIKCLESRLESDHFDHEIRDFVPATGETRKWILSRIETLKSMLPQARHEDQVRAFGWKSVERNA
tara:strand:+ start:13 stop:237 length:225 start_codon:yes stop_codon:yes gene_type:complete